MAVLRSIVLALATFTRIPLPQLDWEQANKRHILAALPLVGLIIGALLWLWFLLCNVLGIHSLLFAAGLTLIPVLVTGGIHLDGYCDTVDALSSRASTDQKQAILKDPHIGTFAVIGVVVYLLVYFALCAELEQKTQMVLLLGAIAVLSRAAGGFASLVFTPAKSSYLLDTLHKAASKQAVFVCILWFVFAVAVACLLDWLSAVALIGVILLVTLYVRIMSKRQFGGMSGDLAGYLIQLVELGALIALVVVEKVMALV